MKKLFLLIAMALMTVAASAQEDSAVRFGVRATGGMTNVAGDGDDMTFGYSVGVLGEYNFSSSAFIQAGLIWDNIAFKTDAIDGTINASYIKIPVHVGFRSGGFFAQAGPYVAYGIAGSDIEWYSSKTKTNYFDDAKRFDFGVGARIGYEFSKIQISAGADYGILDVSDGGGYHNLNINVGIGYMF